MSAALKSEILRLTREYVSSAHARKDFIPGTSDVPYGGRVFDADEVEAAVGSMLDFWLTLGPEAAAFQKEFSHYLGVLNTVLVNSGSSANLIALSALTSDKLGDRRIRHGDEVITAAAGFPTTVTPIVQCGAVPVFVDSHTTTLNARMDQVREAYSPGKTKAVMLAHTLGNPFELAAMREFCDAHNLWLIEDNCDALGSTYAGKLTGSFGDLSTQSFFPAHHITMGEGGAVNIPKQPRLAALAESFRDWGRDCWCAAGSDDTCHKRFGWKLGTLPDGYDHKYTYRHLGYNLKPLDPQAAIGRQQLKKLPEFSIARRRNWQRLRSGLHDLSHLFEFMLPTHATEWRAAGFGWDRSDHISDPDWFGFTLTVRPDAPFTRNELAQALVKARIGNRMLFGGNLTRQPVFINLKKENPNAFRVVGDLKGADHIMNHCLFIGTYAGLTDAMIDYMIETIHQFVKTK